MKTIVSILILTLPLIVGAQVGAKNFIDLNYIEVTGKAEMEVVPDEIYMNIFIKEKDSKGKENLEKLEKKMLKKLEETGVDISNDLSIKDFASNFKNYWLRGDKIFTSKQYQLVTHDGLTTGKVFRELEKLGISNISIEKVSHSKIEKFRRDVKIKAIIAAKEKASAMAEAIGQAAGKAIFIQEMNYGFGRGRMENMASNIKVMGISQEIADDSLPEIEFEKIKLEYSIMAKFELK